MSIALEKEHFHLLPVFDEGIVRQAEHEHLAMAQVEEAIKKWAAQKQAAAQKEKTPDE
jgi:hypothetical protein